MPGVIPRHLQTIELVRALVSQGQTAREIAPLFGVGAGTVTKWLARGEIPTGKMGRPRGSQNEEPKGERAKAMVAAMRRGEKPRNVAFDFGVSRPNIYKLYRRWVQPKEI